MDGPGGLVAIVLGLLLAVGGAALVVFQMRALRGPAPPPPPTRPATPPPGTVGSRLGQLRAQLTARLRRPSAHPAVDPERERQRRLQDMRAQRGGMAGAPRGAGHPAPLGDLPAVAGSASSVPPTLVIPVQAGELVEAADRLPDSVPRRGGRPPRQVAGWRRAVSRYTDPQAPGYQAPASRVPRVLLAVLGTIALTAIVVVGLLLFFGGGARAIEPGSAVLLIAEFGEGPTVQATSAGRTAAQNILQETQARLKNAPKTIAVASARLIHTAAEAQQELERQRAQALLWGTLPAGITGPISATLNWRASLPPLPWLRYGPVGRLLMPPTVPLPASSGRPLEPALVALEYYQAGDYESARAYAEAVPADAPSQTVNLAGFIRANALLALDRGPEAIDLYKALESRGWTLPALYNNWGVAATLQGDPGGASHLLIQAADLTPSPADLATVYINYGIAAEAAGDLAAALAAYDKALAAAPNNAEANWRRGYLAYRAGDGVGATTYTQKAQAADAGNPEIERQLGLIALMERQPASALEHFQKALETYTIWDTRLRADESAAVSRGDIRGGSYFTDQIRAVNQERGTTQYYIGMAYADEARAKPPEGFLAGLWRRATGGKNEADKAIAAFEEAIRLDRDREDVRYQMGLLFWQQGDRGRARETLNRAKELRADRPGPYEALAQMAIQDKKPDQAIAEYRALIAANPGYIPAYNKLADLYAQVGDNVGQQDVYNRMITLPAQTSREHLMHAQALVGLSRPAEAIQEAQAALAGDPGLWEAHLLAARLYQRAHQDSAALSEYGEVLKRQPDHIEALYESGRLDAAHGQIEEAARLWGRVETLQPDHPEVHFALGGLYEQQAALARQAGKPAEANQRTELALQEYKLAVEKQANRPDAYYHLGQLYEQRGAWQEAEKNYANAVKANADLVEAWEGLVRVQLKQPGRDSEALKSAQAFHDHASGDLRAYLLLGDVFLYRNDSSAALAQYQEAQRIQPGDPRVLASTGRAYHQQGQYDRAEQYYTAALQAQPSSAPALTGLGDVALDRGRNGDAKARYDTALQADPNYAPAWVGLGRTLTVLAVADPKLADEARNKLQRAAEIDPTAAEPHYYLGDLYAPRTMWEQALQEYTIAARLRPAWALPQYRLGQIYLSQQKVPEALKAYREASRLNPQMIEAWFGLGQAARALGQRKDAIAAYREALKLRNDYAVAWLYLGYTLEEDGQRPDAADAFRHAVDSANDDATIRAAAQEALRRFP